MKEFLIEVIKGLEERDFVERYAWFPFDPDDDYGGASGIFDYATGELNELGKTYAMLGLPEGYEGAVYDVDISLGDDTDRTVPVTKVTIDKAKTTMYVGESMVLSASCTPANATDQTLTFSSSAPAVATVDKNTGKVTALKAGTVVITAAAGNGRQDTITLTITEKTTVKPTEPQTPTVTLSAIKVSTKTVLTKQK